MNGVRSRDAMEHPRPKSKYVPKVGDVVHLKGGRSEMTVLHIQGEEITCEFGNRTRRVFAASRLVASGSVPPVVVEDAGPSRSRPALNDDAPDSKTPQ
ncbi:uncharacterized protein DUF2158 [Comamonas sp. BIGb0124]|nr:uncharacterized protein DUF2158 [Comamonas sp. BIGb0124]